MTMGMTTYAPSTNGGVQPAELPGPSQAIWNAVLKAWQNNPADSVAAIRTVWRAMPPPGDLPGLATVTGALFADIYWTMTGFDSNTLAADLNKGTLLNPDVCGSAARQAFTQWHGLLVRANWGDSGLIPRGGSLTASPDVVINPNTELSAAEIISMWNQYVWSPSQLKNYAYGRAQSAGIGVPIQKPVVRMYFSEAALNPRPQSWTQMFTWAETSPEAPLVTQDNKGIIPPLGRCANDGQNGFNFTPPGGGHFCVITVAGTEFFTNNPLSVPGNWDAGMWLANNGAAGWHNIDRSNSARETVKVHNQDARPERFLFEAHCNRLPAGTTVSLDSDNGLPYRMSSGEVQITEEQQVVTAEAELPPNFDGTLALRYQTPTGGTLPDGSAIDVRMRWIIPQGHGRYVDAARHLGDVEGSLLGRPMLLDLGNFTFLGA